ncbi:MAG: alpha/beta hydrolase [Betaproteobacteria bacterium]|nr:alpha/beta hydrolase [Betaproteobacteria bacterium]
MDWITDAVTEDSIIRREFTVECAGRKVPGVLWTPAGVSARLPLLLAGHGGSGHKTSQLVLDFARPLVRQGCAVTALDGPVHGARRAVFADGLAVRDEFLALWRAGGSVDPMVADWRAAIDVLCELPEIDANAIGWYGVSMGTAYGLPLLAAEPRIRAAVLGMWGLSYPNSGRLALDAPLVQCPLLFQQKWDDEIFTRDSQIELFDRLGAPDKRLKVYMGDHKNPEGEQLDDIFAFLLKRLRPHT